ncbi:MAG: hypothetical protein ACOX3T_05430 [Bdellovibrionota bacterium]
MANKLNSILVAIFDIFLYPVRNFSDEIKILYISILSGIIFLLVYGKVSNQKGLKKTKRKVAARILEVALYRHSVKVCLNAQLELLKQGVRYLTYALVPLLILMIPALLIMAQMNFNFQNRGLKLNEDAIIEISFDKASDLFDYSLSSDKGTVSPSLRIEDESKVFWKFKVDNIHTKENKNITLNLVQDGGSLSIPVKLSDNGRPEFSTCSKSFFEAILFPSKYSISKDFKEIESISIRYPKAEQSYFGIKLNWIYVFLIVSILSGLVASKIFKVEI